MEEVWRLILVGGGVALGVWLFTLLNASKREKILDFKIAIYKNLYEKKSFGTQTAIENLLENFTIDEADALLKLLKKEKYIYILKDENIGLMDIIRAMSAFNNKYKDIV